MAETIRTSARSSGPWQRAPDDERIDASLLIPAVRGALPRDDRRTASTLEEVGERLTDEGFVNR